ncbi:glycerate kinase [Patescibacteria group bacterium]
MRILVCPDSYKHSLSCTQVSEIIGEELESQGYKLDLCPIADGGEGTVDTFLYSLGGKRQNIKVRDPFGCVIDSYYGIKGNMAFIEMALASGLQYLSDDEKNPWKTTTFGVGEMILDALDKGVKDILIGIGGSATNDVGIGMAQALGVRFFDEDCNEINGISNGKMAGGDLINIKKIEIDGLDKRIKDINLTVLCDVDNPLCGENGASYVYAPQKGADQEMVELLEKGVMYFSDLCIQQFNRNLNFAGAGAAGGLGAGLSLFCDAQLSSGIEVLIDYLNLEDRIKKADLVIVGEGQMDFQTVYGKAPAGITKLAKKHGKDVIAIVGKVGKGFEKNFEVLKMDHIFSCYGELEEVKLHTIRKHGEANLRKLMKEVSIKLPKISLYKNQLTLMP